jgi:hypothetical protein
MGFFMKSILICALMMMNFAPSLSQAQDEKLLAAYQQLNEEESQLTELEQQLDNGPTGECITVVASLSAAVAIFGAIASTKPVQMGPVVWLGATVAGGLACVTYGSITATKVKNAIQVRKANIERLRSTLP